MSSLYLEACWLLRMLMETVSTRKIPLDDTSSEIVSEYQAAKLQSGRFVGFIGKSFRCIHMRITRCAENVLHLFPTPDIPIRDQQQSTPIPNRLCAWRLSKDGKTFAYGGEEVDLSVWDVQRAFETKEVPPGPTKRKRESESALFPGEIWRAKKCKTLVPNDVHGLRQPIHITTLSYISPTQILTGTQSGCVRRYDTRTANRPVNNWTKVAKVGGIKCVQKGFNEHEAFVSDNGTNLYALDSRTGGILYAYKGLAGATASMAPAPGHIMCSISLDRYARIHTTIPPPTVEGTRVDQKGEVMAKEYLTLVPSAVVWDENPEDFAIFKEVEGMRIESDRKIVAEEEDDIWVSMEQVEDEGRHQRSVGTKTGPFMT